jgi:hypothetical protein
MKRGKVEFPWGIKIGKVEFPWGIKRGKVEFPWGIKRGKVEFPWGIKRGKVEAPRGRGAKNLPACFWSWASGFFLESISELYRFLVLGFGVGPRPHRQTRTVSSAA